MPAPPVFDEQDCIDEFNEACRIFGEPQKYSAEIAAFKFKAYSDPRRKVEVRTLCSGKCAYCESYYAATDRGDVEHYRPKGAIACNGKKTGRGYFWLAASWTNLLPACGNCNTRQEQVMAGVPRLQMVGKGNEFPIADGRRRARKPGREIHESPLLLNPFDHQVDEFLRFRPDGQVEPAEDSVGNPRVEAVESIKIYGLQRLDLVRARGELGRLIRAQIERLALAYKEFAKRNGDETSSRTLSFEWGEVERAEADSSPYAGMARQLFQTIPPHIRQRIAASVAQIRAKYPHGFANRDPQDLFQ